MNKRLKDILEENHIVVVDKVALVPQNNGNDIVMEECTIDGDLHIVIVSDDTKDVVVC